MMNRYQDQVVAVTGGGDGLGKAVALRMAEEGAKVALIDFQAETLKKTVEEFKSKGFEALGIAGDVSSEESVNAAFAQIEATYGQLDVMVNSAGIVGPTKINFSDVELADFQKVNAVNLTGSFLTAKAAVKLMEKRNYGRVLLIASIAGKEGNAGMSCYSTSKSGVIGLVKAAGKEYAETNITTNGLAPAVIRTAMVENMPEEQVQYMTDKIPMKRCGTLEEVASICAFICSKEAGFNTGHIFDISGGRATY